MRLVRLAIPNDIVSAIERMLDDEELDYYRAPESTSDQYDTILHVVVETPAVEPMPPAETRFGIRAPPSARLRGPTDFRDEPRAGATA